MLMRHMYNFIQLYLALNATLNLKSLEKKIVSKRNNSKDQNASTNISTTEKYEWQKYISIYIVSSLAYWLCV